MNSIRANDPALRSWVSVPADSDFPIQNLPFGVFRTAELPPRLGVAIGDQVADLQVLADHGFFDDLGIASSVFSQFSINPLMAQGKEKTRALRNRLSEILDSDLEEWDASELAEFFLHPQADVQMLLPVEVGDYTDFYSSLEHASNVGAMFRGPENALLPNWRRLPVAYHGRSSSIVVSGTPIRRPWGQHLPAGETTPRFAPSQQLDFELETAFVIGRPSALGQPISAAEADDYIFGMLLFNDWSARDIQRWEYQPLGPFLGKNFASTISPWVVTLDALEPFRVAGPLQEPPPLAYLECAGEHNYDIHLEVQLHPEGGKAETICRSNARYLYWNICQQLAHHTVNGCNVNIGDVMASGTISSPEPEGFGSMLERTWGGTHPLVLQDGSQRTFLNDGDTITLRGWCSKNGVRIGFGKAVGQLLPAIER